MDLSEKKIVIGLCGGIAIYKTAHIVRRLTHDYHAEVTVIMTDAAQKFMTPLIFETFSGKPVVTMMFPQNRFGGTEHIDFAQESDLILIIPATVNIIGKAANGIADDILSAVISAGLDKTLFVPAMNTNMWKNPIVQANIRKLQSVGVDIINPTSGDLACNTYGPGHLEMDEEIFARIFRAISHQDFAGKTVLITGGPTTEAIDPVRLLSNPSSGKMGAALARAAYFRGADVILVTGRSASFVPKNVKQIPVTTASEMGQAVQNYLKNSDIVIFAAAVEDYKPSEFAKEKIKKSGKLTLTLERTVDVLKQAGKLKKNQIFVGYSLETENAIYNSQKKMQEKKCDLMVVNSPSGFGEEKSSVSLLLANGEERNLSKLMKFEIANVVFDAVLEQINE